MPPVKDVCARCKRTVYSVTMGVGGHTVQIGNMRIAVIYQIKPDYWAYQEGYIQHVCAKMEDPDEDCKPLFGPPLPE